jgi:hypothetical protein
MSLSIKKLLKPIYTLIVMLFNLATPIYAFADVLGDRLSDLEQTTDEKTFLEYIYQLAIPLAVFSLVGLSIYAGFLMVTSQGNPEKLQEAKETITNAVLGFAMVALSIALLALLGGILNIS